MSETTIRAWEIFEGEVRLHEEGRVEHLDGDGWKDGWGHWTPPHPYRDQDSAAFREWEAAAEAYRSRASNAAGGAVALDPSREAQARAAVDIAHPFQVVTFAPRLDADGLRAMALAAAEYGTRAEPSNSAWAALAGALYAAAERDAAGHGAAIGAIAHDMSESLDLGHAGGGLALAL